MIPLATALRIAPYAAIGLLALGLLWYRGEAIDAAADLKAKEVQLVEVKQANEAQAKTIERITAQRAADDALLANLSTTLTDLQAKTEETQATIAELERTNAQIKSYLATPVPVELRGLLNRPTRK